MQAFHSKVDRREFLQRSLVSGAAVAAISTVPGLSQALAAQAKTKMKFGLVTYLWGQHMDLPTCIAACEKSGLAGVELRTQHKHGVEPSLSAAERQEVRKRFADTPVKLIGMGRMQSFMPMILRRSKPTSSWPRAMCN